MDHERGLSGPSLEWLDWTGLREEFCLSIAHMVRWAPGCVVHGLGELICDLGMLCSLTSMSGVSSTITAVTHTIGSVQSSSPSPSPNYST